MDSNQTTTTDQAQTAQAAQPGEPTAGQLAAAAGNAILNSHAATSDLHKIISAISGKLMQAEQAFVKVKQEASDWMKKHVLVAEALDEMKKEVEDYISKNASLSSELEQAKKDIEDLKTQLTALTTKAAE